MRRIIILVITTIILIGVLSCILASRNKKRLEGVESYRIYYRGIKESILRDMQEYDLLIVEALNFKEEDVKKAKNKERPMFIGYLSLMSVGYWDEDLLDRMREEDYLLIDNKKAYNKSGENPLADISKEHYQEILLDIIEERIVSKGMDGIFLDTVDWIDYYKFEQNEDVYIKLSQGYEELLKKIRRRYPDMYIIQNRGFESLFKFSGFYIDAILWENFNASNMNKSLESRIKKVREIESKHNVTVFTICFENEKKNEDFVKSLDWKYLYKKKDGRYTKW